MNSREKPAPAGDRRTADALGLYRRIVEGLEDKPAYLLLFGVAALFIISGVGASIAGIVQRDMWQSVLGFLSFIVALTAVFLVVNRVEEPHHALQPAQDLVQVQLNQVRGAIDKPKQGETVARKIECSGWASGLVPELHIWLATEVHGLLWPKGSEIHVASDGSWSKTIFEDGAIVEFSISLFVANADAHRAILKWLQAGEQAGNYERLSGVLGMDRLDRVDGLSLSANLPVGR